MSTLTHPVVTKCPSCGEDLPLESSACPKCHTLVHSERLEQLSRDARALEARGLYPQSRDLWSHSLSLLPHDSKQASWIRDPPHRAPISRNRHS